MEDLLYGIIGISMFYSWVHFLFIQHNKTYKKRTDYERVITWYAIVMFVFFTIGSL